MQLIICELDTETPSHRENLFKGNSLRDYALARQGGFNKRKVFSVSRCLGGKLTDLATVLVSAAGRAKLR